MKHRIFRKRFAPFIVCLMVLFALSGCSQGTAGNSNGGLLVFASASLRDVMQEVGDAFTLKSGIAVTFNFAGSNVLAKQIEASTQADVYLSANKHWVDYLSQRNLIDDKSRRVFLSNNLVVVAPRESGWTLSDPSQLAQLPFKYLSLGNPDAVPAGRYAKQYLEVITAAGTDNSVWSQVSDRLLPASDVRAAASAVANISGLIGIIYKTDAIVSDKLKILYEIELKQHNELERVKYVAASVSKAELSAGASQFLDYIMQEEAQSIFARHGFDSVLDTL